MRRTGGPVAARRSGGARRKPCRKTSRGACWRARRKPCQARRGRGSFPDICFYLRFYLCYYVCFFPPTSILFSFFTRALPACCMLLFHVLRAAGLPAGKETGCSRKGILAFMVSCETILTVPQISTILSIDSILQYCSIPARCCPFFPFD